MKGSIKIAKFFGIPVLLHWSFLLVMAMLGVYGYISGVSWQRSIWVGLFGLAIFLSILLHEFGHALTAKRFGVKTRDIILLPIGGLARLDRLPEKPWQELLVAAAGPFANLGIALLLTPYFWWVTRPALSEHAIPSLDNLTEDFFYFLPLLLFVNLLLAIFNMIPALPMDGGRFLKALLSMKFGRLKATRIAVSLGQFIAVLMIAFSFWRQEWLYSLLGLFIYFTARREYLWAKTEHLLGKYRVKEVLKKEYQHVLVEDDFSNIIPHWNEKGEHVFLVTDMFGGLVGLLDIGQIGTLNPSDKIKAYYEPLTLRLEGQDTLKKAHKLMLHSGKNVLPVYENGQLEGLLENSRIWEYLSEIGK